MSPNLVVAGSIISSSNVRPVESDIVTLIRTGGCVTSIRRQEACGSCHLRGSRFLGLGVARWAIRTRIIGLWVTMILLPSKSRHVWKCSRDERGA